MKPDLVRTEGEGPFWVRWLEVWPDGNRETLLRFDSLHSAALYLSHCYYHSGPHCAITADTWTLVYWEPRAEALEDEWFRNTYPNADWGEAESAYP